MHWFLKFILEMKLYMFRTVPLSITVHTAMVDCVWNVMAQAQKPDFVFRRNGRVHLNQRSRQFSRLLAAELCASAVVMLDTPFFELAWRVLATHSIRQFPLHFPPCVTVCRHISTGLYMSYSFVDSFRESGSGWNCSSILLQSCLQNCMTYTIVECTVNNSRWWTGELSGTCRVSLNNKLEKLVRLVGFAIRKFVTMHGHMHVWKK
jgi:hypothetical protein